MYFSYFHDMQQRLLVRKHIDVSSVTRDMKIVHKNNRKNL